jgi:outer membrane protein
MTTLDVRKRIAILATAAATLACAGPALADDSPNNSLRAGLYAIFYHATADNISGPYVPAGVNIDAVDVTTLYVAYVRTLAPHFDVELALGYPPATKTVGKGPATLGSVPYNGQVISTARWLAPTALLEYVFLDQNANLRPFIGVGVNYTSFYDRNSTAQGNAASGGPTRLSLTSSVGPAATMGLAYNYTKNWKFYASYSASEVKTKLRADTAGVIRTTHISFGPQTLVFSVGYSF